jgi:hypothetical protein
MLIVTAPEGDGGATGGQPAALGPASRARGVFHIEFWESVGVHRREMPAV